MCPFRCHNGHFFAALQESLSGIAAGVHSTSEDFRGDSDETEKARELFDVKEKAIYTKSCLHKIWNHCRL